MGRYFVFNPKADKPRKEYDDYKEALNDAQAISLKEDTNVFVLEVVAEARIQRMVVTTELAGLKKEAQDILDEATQKLEELKNAKKTV